MYEENLVRIVLLFKTLKLSGCLCENVFKIVPLKHDAPCMDALIMLGDEIIRSTAGKYSKPEMQRQNHFSVENGFRLNLIG